MNCPHLLFLDVSNTDFYIKKVKSKTKSKKNKTMTNMEEYHRSQALQSIVHLLQSNSSHLQHLILGHNGLTINECKTLMNVALEQKKLLTFDLFGNVFNDVIFAPFTLNLFQVRKTEELDIIANSSDMCKTLCPEIVKIISEYSLSINHCVYRCHKWAPSPMRKSKKRKSKT